MRTKALLFSALLGASGSVSVWAQTNININTYPGFNIISCPLIASSGNTIGTLLNNGGGQFTGDAVYFYNPSTPEMEIDQAMTPWRPNRYQRQRVAFWWD
jgi:hypothetical protein